MSLWVTSLRLYQHGRLPVDVAAYSACPAWHVQLGMITVRCEARNRDTQSTILSIDKVVFVALDAKGRPTMHKLARLEHDQRKYGWAGSGFFGRLAGRSVESANVEEA